MKNNKIKVSKLRKEIEIKDIIIKELLTLVTNAKVKVPPVLLNTISILFTTTGENK